MAELEEEHIEQEPIIIDNTVVQPKVVQKVDISSHICNQDEHGNWTYVEKALAADTLYGRKAEYQDKAEIHVLEQVEDKSKQDYRNMLHGTVIEIAKYLKTLTNGKQSTTK